MPSDTFDGLRDLYQDVILDHGRRPRHAGKPEHFDATAKGDNPMCGDRVQVFVGYGARRHASPMPASMRAAARSASPRPI